MNFQVAGSFVVVGDLLLPCDHYLGACAKKENRIRFECTWLIGSRAIFGSRVRNAVEGSCTQKKNMAAMFLALHNFFVLILEKILSSVSCIEFFPGNWRKRLEPSRRIYDSQPWNNREGLETETNGYLKHHHRMSVQLVLLSAGVAFLSHSTGKMN